MQSQREAETERSRDREKQRWKRRRKQRETERERETGRERESDRERETERWGSFRYTAASLLNNPTVKRCFSEHSHRMQLDWKLIIEEVNGKSAVKEWSQLQII